jgi:hypothetical protein
VVIGAVSEPYQSSDIAVVAAAIALVAFTVVVDRRRD